MQVKKFEAKTMKDALQMVKEALGPEAIILSAKDNKKSFGLAGGGSIEITAAISEKSLIKKQYVEQRLQPKAKEQFRTQSAKSQRAYIESSITRRQRNSQLDPRIGVGAVAQRPMTSRRYADINDEEDISGRRVDDLLSEFVRPIAATIQEEKPKDEVTSLRREVNALRDLLSQMQNSGSASGRPAMTQHPGAEYGLPFELSANFEKLNAAGMDSKYIVEILEKANSELTLAEKKRRSLVDAWVARYILNNTHVTGEWFRNQQPGLMHLFFGPSGQGKTSALVKMATQLTIYERKRVVILSTDTFKVGATDQLKTYTQILNIPFEIVRHSIEFSQILKKYPEVDAVLVDYPGMALKDIHEIDQIRSLLPSKEIPVQNHLVLSCSSKDQDAYEACNRYQVTNFDDIIVTKIDESYAHGFLFNIQKKTEKPLYAFGLGTKIPEDIELATRERVLDLIYKITKR
jgi:flagellar biosynthesis protein FlhF